MKFLSLVIILITLSGCSAAAEEEKQLRGMWISTVLNIDFPKTEGEENQKKEITDLLDRAAELNMNAVFFQVRSTSDACYISEMVPVSPYMNCEELTYDPLEFIIEEAHKRGIELHAWFNPYRVSMYLDKPIPEGSVYYTHPEWIKTAKNRYVIDPGIPEARLWVEECVMEVVNKYDIDGVHFDDYFYYESEESPLEDDDTFALYGGDFADKGDWRRNNTYLLIKELSEKIRAAKPEIKFGISPAGVWRNKSEDVEGSDTKAGLPNYDRAFADTRRWVREELIDYIAPQIYWSFDTQAAPYKTVVDWWKNQVKDTDVQLYAGTALYRAEEFGIEEIVRQNSYNKEIGVDGTIMFSAADTEKYFTQLKEMWKEKSLIPQFNGKNTKPPEKPEVVAGIGIIRIRDNDEATKYFCIFSKNGRLIKTVMKKGEYTETTGNEAFVVAAANGDHFLSEKVRVRKKVPETIGWFSAISVLLTNILP